MMMIPRTLFKTRKKTKIVIILSLILFYSVYLFIQAENNNYWSPPPAQFNYFQEIDEYSNVPNGYLVNTSTCQILNIDPWDKSIKHLFGEGTEIDCYSRYRHWTHVEGSSIVINKTALLESGYSMDSISCCYKSISRVEQSTDHYDRYADSRVRFSTKCSKMSEYTPVKRGEQFIKVYCTSKLWPLESDIVYRQFHTLALPYQSTSVIRKIKHWNEKGNDNLVRPPNVLLIGVDSISRLGFHRSFPQTKSILERIGAFEMLGYTKVGDNTFPNAIPFLTGYTVEELAKICYFNQQTKFDSCPFIWKGFAGANYLTAYNEDVPFLSTFNYLKTGFVQQPTDFYLRPFFLAVSERTDNVRYTFDCIGYANPYDTVMNYNFQLVNLSMSTNTPLFLSSWLTSVAHQDINSAKFADRTFVKFFKGMEALGALENTIFIFLSDHGYRYGKIRQTFPGWYEDKLPFFWIYIPPSLRKQIPDVDSILHRNARRLSSPFDLYHTMSHSLQLYSKENKSEATHPRQVGQSLLQEIPLSRTCDDAGIPSIYCPCVIPKTVSLDDRFLVNASLAALRYLNNLLPSQCAELSLDSIAGGAVIKMSSSTNSKSASYLVTFLTHPGKFILEANVDYFQNTRTFRVSGNVLRLSKIDRDTSCAKNSVMELYCYCK